MINRDGYRESLWQAAPEPYKAADSSTQLFDVIIVGGGITGLTTALLLQESGKKCAILEAENLCFGTTGGTTAHINTLLDTPYSIIEKNFTKEDAKLIEQSAEAALNLVRTNIQKYQIDCSFQEADAYLFAQNEKEEKELGEIYEASQRAGLQIHYSDELPYPMPFTKLLKAGNQAKFNPVEYVYGLAKAFERLNGVIIQDCRVTNVQEDGNMIITTPIGEFRSADIIYATHIPPGINLLHFRCTPWRTYAMAVELENGNYPEDLAYDMLDPYHYYRSQMVNGKQYLIAGGKDHKTGTEENTDYFFLQLEAIVRKYFNVKQIAYRWSSQYFESNDGLPYIGHLPGHPDHIYVATGYGGNGMTYSHVAANVLNVLLSGKENALTELLDPNRIKPVAGFKSFIELNTAVISNYAGKLWPAEKIQELAQIANGQGMIVKFEDKRMGLYKDDLGNLHAVNPVCTHLKCEVTWNPSERSWDCPCHGGRFDCDGKVITGPADRPLETISLG